MGSDNGENTKRAKLEFYGGKAGAWMPLASLLVFMVGLVVADHATLKSFWTAGFFALCLSYLCAKDKKKFSEVAAKGLTDPMFSTLCMIFFLAGILSYNMRQSGLVNGLLWLGTEWGISPSFLPAITFLVSAVIATACGTSGGTVAAVTPVMLPVGVGMGADAALLMGAIASGAFFGDNLAPISDTTIASSTVMEEEVSAVVKSRLPYSLIAGSFALAAFIFFGHATTGAAAETAVVSASAAKTLLMLVIPVLMVALMFRGCDLVSVLLICDMVALGINVLMGFIPAAEVVSVTGPVVAGIESMLGIVSFEVFLFVLLALMKAGGALDDLLEKVCNFCQNAHQAEMLTAAMIIAATGAMAINTVAIVVSGPIANRLFKAYDLDGCRGANLLDGFSSAVTGLLPYNATMMTLLSLAAATGAIEKDFSPFQMIRCNFHCIMLFLVFGISVISGIGRKKKASPLGN